MRPIAPLLLPILLLAVAACGGPAEAPRIRLATTTSTEDSGLLGFLLSPFEDREGVKVDRIAVGTGQALEISRRGDADIVLVHARAREDEFVAKGFGIDRRDVMWNDFVIAGPNEDPAGLRGGRDATEALKRIAAAGAGFISRGDDSGTHILERRLWAAAGIVPGWPAYKEAGQGMGNCLVIADEKRSYVLADRGTFLSFRKRLALAVLVEGDPALRNPYGAILVNPDRHPAVNAAGARKLLDYLTSAEGRARIAAFKVDGETLFHPHGGE
ncbi:MAG: substrate-binding domain-containing protein [Planctomycetes bacterium]|jgi:tungstate transport system substrate-binding protein|nr:substrate-binding domain-containing protein [Planctomycetota bacterium]